MPVLRVELADRPPFEVPLAAETLTIGRSTESTLSIPSLSLSRNHARLFRDGAKYFLEDCGSRNGTYLNQRQVIGPVPLSDGDDLRLGDVRLRFLSRESPVEVTAGPAAAIDDTSYVLQRKDISFRRFAEASRSGEVRAAEETALWPVLNEAAATLITHYPLEQLLEVVMDIVLRAVRAERGALLLRNPEAPDGLETRWVRPPNAGESLRISRTVVRQVIEEQQAVLTADARVDDRFQQAQSLRIQGIRSVLCAPLWNEREVIGLIYVDRQMSAQAFSQSDLRLVGLIANMAAVKIENARLLIEQLEKERLAGQVQAAAQIQRGLLPQGDPLVPGYQVRGASRPCYEMGGDYYDFLHPGGAGDPGRLAVVIADVSGKGVPAALLMAAFQASLRALASVEPDPAALVRKLNEALLANSPRSKFVTAFYGELDLVSHSVLYVNAGHNPPIVVGPGGTRTLASTGPVIGLLPRASYSAQRIELLAGDLLVLYTDGVTECTDPRDEEFGLERLSEFFAPRTGQDLDTLRRSFLEHLTAFSGGAPAKDDSTLILLRRET